MDNTVLNSGEQYPLISSLADYMAEGKNFLEACRLRLNDFKREENKERDHSREELDTLKEFLSLLRSPDRYDDRKFVDFWLPPKYTDREKRLRNYFLWSSFTNRRHAAKNACPAIHEGRLLKALHAGRNTFERKHHIFNLLVAMGFPQRQACILAKYLGNK